MPSNIRLVAQLLEILSNIANVTQKQNEMIIRLVNENLEKENMISVMLEDIEKS